MHFPYLIVDAPSALHMRESIVCALWRTYDERIADGENNWATL